MGAGGTIQHTFFGSFDEPEQVGAVAGGAVVFTTAAPYREADDDNQDAAGVFADTRGRSILVVADGMGGGPLGATASRLAIETIGRVFAHGARESQLRSVVLDGIEAAQQAVRGLGSGAGCTVNVVEVADGSARSYHVGDSTTLLVGQRGKVKHQTIAHGPTGYAVEAGFIDEEEAMVHEERHVVSNVLGAAEMRIEMGPPLPLAARDTVLLATDGVSDNLTTAEVIELVRSGPLARAARRLRDTCRQRMATPAEGEPSKPDDLTFILFRPGGGRG